MNHNLERLRRLIEMGDQTAQTEFDRIRDRSNWVQRPVRNLKVCETWFGRGDGDGFGFWSGSGFRNGVGDGFGYGNGNGFGDGIGNGLGFGFGGGFGNWDGNRKGKP